MKIYKVRKRITTQRFFAVGLMAVCTVFLISSFLKSIYFSMPGDATALFPLSQAVQNAVYFVYKRTQFVSWVWELAPVINPLEINTSGNFGFLFIAICGALGRILWDNATHLSSRIAQTIQRVEELEWKQELMGQRGQLPGTKPDVLQINIELDQKDQWYARPMGVVFLGIAIAVLGQWANLKLGLTK